MQYLLLIFTPEAEMAKLTPEAGDAMRKEYFALMESTRESGNYIGGNALQPTTTASTVRVRDGKRTVTDGPFAETKEQLAGYFLVQAQDLDEAIGIAERIPGARSGSVEVRPVRQIPQQA